MNLEYTVVQLVEATDDCAKNWVPLGLEKGLQAEWKKIIVVSKKTAFRIFTTMDEITR